ncbi:MAG: hypothetical protein JNJ54_31095 [Myxococcaceae bacterium]|nr:hypothetical protein [Myxococcaceae bacterium]
MSNRLLPFLLIGASCTVPDGVVFRCEPDGSCPRGLTCVPLAGERYCVVADGGSAGGSTAGGSTAGGSTAGGSTAGGSMGGGSTAGGSTAGGSTAGGSTAGGSTAGGSTAGGSTAGGSTAGGSTAGGSTAGGSTAGGSTAGGSTAGGSTAGGSTAGGSTAGGSTAGGLAAPCDPAEQVDQMKAVFVSPTGDDLLPGSIDFPVASIGKAADLAAASGATTIYISNGTYPGNVSLSGTSLALLGGWTVVFGTWTRDCSAGARSQTRILALDAGPAVSVADAGFVFRSLFVQTLLMAAPVVDQAGGSRTALVASNANVTLSDVGLVATDGVPGGTASLGASGGVRSCSGVADCQEGAAGTPWLTTARPSDGGRFTANGFIAGDGTPGQAGPDGQAGRDGGLGQTAMSCYLGCGCGVNCVSTGPLPQQAEAGRCGCGGRGGSGGGAGRGGGASVAVLAVNSTIRADFSSLQAGRGGNGSSGGAGGQGALGTDGGTGMGVRCQTKPCRFTVGSNCSMMPVACYYGNGPGDEVFIDLQPGVPGGPGGRGADGQQGGSGAGGPSVAVVLVGNSALLLDGGTVLRVSDGGIGGPGARNGASALIQAW